MPWSLHTLVWYSGAFVENKIYKVDGTVSVKAK